MTRSVTSADALVLSPAGRIDDPKVLPEVVDAFARLLVDLREGVARPGWVDGRFYLAHPTSPDMPFRATPILAGGFTLPEILPRAWEGRVTRSLVAEHLRSTWHHAPREPSWGAHLPFGDVRVRPDGLEVELVNPAKRPLIDPLRESAGQDDARWRTETVELVGPWAKLLTEWDAMDAYLAGIAPGDAWLRRRSITVRVASGRWWWQLRGLRDAGDGQRYEGMEAFSGPHTVTVFLGWHAYIIAAAGRTTPCESCGGVAIEGRRYCGARDCDRARVAARQRLHRNGPRVSGR